MLLKILRSSEWEQFAAEGRFDGSAADLRDGFIHLSTADQAAGTVARHFSGEKGLVFVEVDPGEDVLLRFETSRNGALFPHLYRPLTLSDVVGIRRG